MTRFILCAANTGVLMVHVSLFYVSISISHASISTDGLMVHVSLFYVSISISHVSISTDVSMLHVSLLYVNRPSGGSCVHVCIKVHEY